jgi:hypothetical protein
MHLRLTKVLLKAAHLAIVEGWKLNPWQLKVQSPSRLIPSPELLQPLLS